LNGTFRKEYSEFETSNEVNFMKKLTEIKNDSKVNQKTILDIQSNMKNIDVNNYLNFLFIILF
jgi:hypothetical protein